MIRSTRQGSVLRSASGRSGSSALSSSCSSAVGPGAVAVSDVGRVAYSPAQVLQPASVVLGQVVEIGGDPQVSRPRIDDEPASASVPHIVVRILPRQHHDRAAFRAARSHPGPEAALHGECNQVFSERRAWPRGSLASPISSMIASPPSWAYTEAIAGVPISKRRASLARSSDFGVEAKGRRMRKPAGHSRLQPLMQLGAHVQKRDTGPAQQPLEPAAAVEVHTAGVRPPPGLAPPPGSRPTSSSAPLRVRQRGHRGEILDRAAGEEYVAGRHQGGAVVDRLAQTARAAR